MMGGRTMGLVNGMFAPKNCRPFALILGALHEIWMREANSTHIRGS